MKESRFVGQNKKKWEESETLLKEPAKDPEKLSALFIQIVDDLSYSRTYYRNRSVRVYLNTLARDFFSILYGYKQPVRNRFRVFWTDEIPQVIVHARKQLTISFLVFALAAGIGVFSAARDPQFANVILNEAYVRMTEQNIKNGDPMAVYKSIPPLEMFLKIAYNNLMVTARTYALGIFLSLGTLTILMDNGIMVGCFQYFFVERGLFLPSALAIWLHGTLEIPSIILAGGAGLLLGTGLLFPGTYSRLQAFQLSAIRSLKLMLAITPVIILAALIEGFLTRYTDAPNILRGFLILLSLAFVVSYFIIYPWYKSRTGFKTPWKDTGIAPEDQEPVSFTRIKSNGEILKDAFLFYKKNWTVLLRAILSATLVSSLAHLFLTESETPRTGWPSFWNAVGYGLRLPSAPIAAINALATGWIVHQVFRLIGPPPELPLKNFSSLLSGLQTFVFVGCLYTAFYNLGWLGSFVGGVAFVILLLSAIVQTQEKSNLFAATRRAWTLAMANPAQFLGLQLILLILGMSFLLIAAAPISYLSLAALRWNFTPSDTTTPAILRFIEILTKLFAFNLGVPVFAGCVGYLYFTLREIADATRLKESISMMGRKRKTSPS